MCAFFLLPTADSWDNPYVLLDGIVKQTKLKLTVSGRVIASDYEYRQCTSRMIKD